MKHSNLLWSTPCLLCIARLLSSLTIHCVNGQASYHDSNPDQENQPIKEQTKRQICTILSLKYIQTCQLYSIWCQTLVVTITIFGENDRRSNNWIWNKCSLDKGSQKESSWQTKKANKGSSAQRSHICYLWLLLQKLSTGERG